MARRIRKPPVDPVIAAHLKRQEERKPENWGISADGLSNQDDVTVVLGAKNEARAARRDDVFHRLHARGSLSSAALVAMRRLQADMSERAGEGAFGHGEKVDGGSGSRELVGQRQLDAGDRVDAALSRIGARDAALLKELIAPRRVLVAEGCERWRLVVAAVCGETHTHAQAAALRAACENLSEAYMQIDKEPPRPRRQARDPTGCIAA